MSKQTKPSIVFAQGIWANGSSFGKLIPALQAEGHEVIAAQYGLDTLAGDVATVKNALAWISGVRRSSSGTHMAALSSRPRTPICALPGSFTSLNSRPTPTRRRRVSRASPPSRTFFPPAPFVPSRLWRDHRFPRRGDRE
jgi:hypothetical protein